MTSKSRSGASGVNREGASLRSANQRQTPQTRILPTKRCRDCPAEFEVDDPRRRLCDFCRWLHKRTIGNRASRKWYGTLTPDEKQRIYNRQNAWQQSHRLHIAQHRKSRAA